MSHLLEKAQQQPDKGTRSVLDPHYEVIATLRKKHWTFREIADFFQKEGIQVSVTWLTQYWALKNGASKKSSPRKKSMGFQKKDPKTENAEGASSTANPPEKVTLFEYKGLFE